MYNASSEEIYQLILDLPAIAMEFPVIKSVDSPSQGHYIFTFAVDFSMYSGTYQASVHVVDQRPTEYLHLKGNHKSRVARLHIDLQARISPRNSQEHELTIVGLFEVGGMMRFAGKTVIANGVDFGLKLMFDFLQYQLDQKKAAS